MTCTIKTRASAPELLLALRDAEEAQRAAWARYTRARDARDESMTRITWGFLLAAEDAVRAANHAHRMAIKGEG